MPWLFEFWSSEKIKSQTTPKVLAKLEPEPRSPVNGMDACIASTYASVTLLSMIASGPKNTIDKQQATALTMVPVTEFLAYLRPNMRCYGIFKDEQDKIAHLRFPITRQRQTYTNEENTEFQVP